MTEVCPGSAVKGAGTVSLASFLDYVKSNGTSSLNTLLSFVLYFTFNSFTGGVTDMLYVDIF